MQGTFTFLDLTLLILYLSLTVFLGSWISRSSKKSGDKTQPKIRPIEDYFIGNRKIPSWAVLVSVVATETSSLTFISIPGLAYIGDFTFLQIAMGFLLGRVLIAYFLLPRYYAGNVLSIYEILERRFGRWTRRAASLVFMATRAFGDSVRIFATSIPIALLLIPLIRSVGLPDHLEHQWESLLPMIAILTIGVITFFYTYWGGMKAVIWTDVAQSTIYLLGGIAALVLIGNSVPGGWGEIFAKSHPSEKLRVFDFSLGFDQPHTLFAGLLGGAFLSMATHGVDQMMVQRLFATKSLAAARRALIGSGVFIIFQFALFLLIGTGLFQYYGGKTFESSDTVFPTFILEAMPSGLTGLVVAAILAAAMSTISSSLNSLAAATTLDFYQPLFHQLEERSLLRAARFFTFFWALVLIGGAMLYSDQKTPVVTLALSIASFTYGGLLGIFLLGNSKRKIKEGAVLAGMIGSILIMSALVFARQIILWFPAFAPWFEAFATIAWPWYVLLGTALTWTLAYGISYFGIFFFNLGVLLRSAAFKVGASKILFIRFFRSG